MPDVEMSLWSVPVIPQYVLYLAWFVIIFGIILIIISSANLTGEAWWYPIIVGSIHFNEKLGQCKHVTNEKWYRNRTIGKKAYRK